MNKQKYKVYRMKVYSRQANFNQGLYIRNSGLREGSTLNMPKSNRVNHLMPKVEQGGALNKLNPCRVNLRNFG
jgi:hypothetical protein